IGASVEDPGQIPLPLVLVDVDDACRRLEAVVGAALVPLPPAAPYDPGVDEAQHALGSRSLSYADGTPAFQYDRDRQTVLLHLRRELLRARCGAGASVGKGSKVQASSSKKTCGRTTARSSAPGKRRPTMRAT